MKKFIFTAALVSAFAVSNAQLTSKNGTPILPEAGDWSIGFDAVPILRYFGNLLSDAGNNQFTMEPQQHMTIVGLYMKDESTAYRGRVGINFGSTSADFFTPKDGSTTNPPVMVTDERSTSSMGINIGAGIQKFRGKGRLKGIYGAEVLIGFGNSGSTEFSYGNPMNVVNGGANSSNFDPNDPTAFTANAPSRTTEVSGGSIFNLGIRGFIGAEYFFAPKMSISAEYGWGLAMNSVGEGETSVERINGSSGTNVVETITTSTGGTSSFNIGVDATGQGNGSIVLHFYF